MTAHGPTSDGLLLIKGHGTQNDFLVLPDLDGDLNLDADLVQALCDRHRGIGADGILRVVRTGAMQDLGAERPDAALAPYFMDYRNADGSVAETCGNGLRVFARYLQSVGLVGHGAAVATRGGIMRTRFAGADVTVDMGSPQVLADRPIVTAARTDRAAAATPTPGVALSMPNPHVVVAVSAADLDTLDLTTAPSVNPPLPFGQNVEFVARLAARHLRLRVHERGVGETRSCGTGICAAVVATALGDTAVDDTAVDDTAPASAADGSEWIVDVPGGRLRVVWGTDGRVSLTGPAVLVATVRLDAAELAQLRS